MARLSNLQKQACDVSIFTNKYNIMLEAGWTVEQYVSALSYWSAWIHPPSLFSGSWEKPISTSLQNIGLREGEDELEAVVWMFVGRDGDSVLGSHMLSVREEIWKFTRQALPDTVTSTAVQPRQSLGWQNTLEIRNDGQQTGNFHSNIFSSSPSHFSLSVGHKNVKRLRTNKTLPFWWWPLAVVVFSDEAAELKPSTSGRSNILSLLLISQWGSMVMMSLNGFNR